MQFEDFMALISENVRPNSLYHYTPQWASMLNDNDIIMSRLVDSEEIATVQKAVPKLDRSYRYYLSTGRSIRNSYTEADIKNQYNPIVVVFELDRNKLAADFKIIPVDYQASTLDPDGGSNEFRHRGSSETEDRVMSKKQNVPLSKYLVAVHALVKGETPDAYQYVRKMIAHYEDIIRRIESGETVMQPAQSNIYDASPYVLKDVQFKLKQAHERIAQIRNNMTEGESRFRAMAEEADEKIPFWIYSNQHAFMSARWAEAEQANPAMWEDDDEL